MAVLSEKFMFQNRFPLNKNNVFLLKNRSSNNIPVQRNRFKEIGLEKYNKFQIKNDVQNHIYKEKVIYDETRGNLVSVWKTEKLSQYLDPRGSFS